VTTTESAASTKRIFLTTLASLVAAMLILVAVVLPAEYQLDLLGTGEMLGLLGLSREAPTAVTNQQATFRVDTVSYELGSFESVEYKYRLEQGASLVFDWQATSAVVFELHAEPDGAEAGYAETFAKGRSPSQRGTYVAQFPGIHGWFWENRSPTPVTVTLITSGFYSGATEFRDGFETPMLPSTAAELLVDEPSAD
jgi:hypothetical protein